MDDELNISFVIPLYNLERWIILCLDSIYQSQLVDGTFEVIVWDDGSKDKSANIVQDYAKSHNGIRLISKENHGVSYVRNCAITEAKGKYIWFVDADDVVNSENVHKLVDLALASDLDMLLFNWKPVEMTGDIEDVILHKISTTNVIPGRQLYMDRMISMAPWCFLYRRDFLMDKELTFPENFKTCEDILFNQKALWYAKKTMGTGLIGYYYRKMNVSATQGNYARLVNDHIRKIPLEIDFFSKYKDWEYLSVILYRNLREINVWIGVDHSDKSVYRKISESLSQSTFKIRPLMSIMALYVFLMKSNPLSVCKLQRIINKCKNALR